METLLDKYENTTGEITVPVSESVGKAERQPTLSKKERKIFKALAKALRKHNRLLEQEAERRRAEEESAANRAAAEKAAKRKNGGGFLGGFTKAICKVLPQIVTAAITAVLGFFFSKPSRKTLRAAL